MYFSSGISCTGNAQCSSNICIDGLCKSCTSDDQCPANSRCDSGECTLVPNGDSCAAGKECLSNRCVVGVCRSKAGAIAEACTVGEECESGLCRGEVCAPCNVHAECGDGHLCYARRCIATPVMGNGLREPGEVCDDGNTADGDGCSSRGQLENGQNGCSVDGDCASGRCAEGTCAPCGSNEECSSALCVGGVCGNLCGNAFVDPGEECDRGPENSDFQPNQCRTDCRNPRCGDSITDKTEQCDDGNIADSDGCDSACRIEVRTVTIDLPLTPFRKQTAGEIARGHAPAGQTGPAAIAVMAAGGAAGWAWVRRRRK